MHHCCAVMSGTDGDMQWYLSQVKGTIEEDVTEGKLKYFILTVMVLVFNFLKI